MSTPLKKAAANQRPDGETSKGEVRKAGSLNLDLSVGSLDDSEESESERTLPG
jgi:hypothetical protein